MRIRFGEFLLDLDGRQLFRENEPVHLWPKAFDLLKLLVESRPRALSKTELFERLWPETFVSEATLASLVAELRRTLGDTAHDSRFVRTVQAFGYAFSGEAIELAQRTGPTAPLDVGYWVVWEAGQAALSLGENILGRDRDVAVWLDSPTVSRHHARILISGDQVMLEDLASKNGTYMRGERIT